MGVYKHDPMLEGEIAQRFCRDCGLSYGWLEYRKVGPNLPQRSIRFTCANCKQEQSCGLIYKR